MKRMKSERKRMKVDNEEENEENETLKLSHKIL
jgi:hypothetical protein